MTLVYQSTRDENNTVTASQAILQGLATDGGLFTPVSYPQVELDFDTLKDASYQEVAKLVLSAFLDDFTEEELDYCITNAYDDKFDTAAIAPVVKLQNHYNLELFHGSTIAFKDMALSILPYLLTTSAKKQGVDNKIVILTATSGDTGKAAMAGFADVPGTEIIVFYPKDGVSKIQELQMTTQTGANTHVIAIDGNFDDAQTDVKRMFNDVDLREKLLAHHTQFSSANSMNVGRLVPQVVYYVYAYARLLANEEIAGGEQINVVVPTGNFGNILAAYFAKRMGVPIKTLICASNDNKVLYDFFTTGTYDRRREFILTNSPSMDILISSNLERLIYMSTGCDALASGNLMRGLSREGRYEVTPEMRAFMSDFVGGFATQEQNAATIKKLFDDTGYLIDTHTGVAASVYGNYRKESGDDTKTVIASTASPYKFSHSVMEAIAGREGLEGKDEFEIVDALSALSGVAVPQAVEEIRHAAIRHSRECGADDMKAEVKDILGIS